MATKRKSLAVPHVPAHRDACAAQIKRIGDLTREAARLRADMNDAIAAITEAAAPKLTALEAEANALTAGVQVWCEANRAAITDNHKVKTAHLITGEVSWRVAPPSVTVRQADVAVLTLKRLGATELVRTKEEVNKEAVLGVYAEAARITPEQIEGEAFAPKRAALQRVLALRGFLQSLSNIAVNSGAETFCVTPFEQEAA